MNYEPGKKPTDWYYIKIKDIVNEKPNTTAIKSREDGSVWQMANYDFTGNRYNEGEYEFIKDASSFDL